MSFSCNSDHIKRIIERITDVFASIIFLLYLVALVYGNYHNKAFLAGVVIFWVVLTLWRIDFSLIMLLLFVPFLNWLNITGFTNGNILLPISAGIFLVWHIKNLLFSKKTTEDADLIDLYSCTFSILASLSFCFLLLWSIVSSEKLPLPFFISFWRISDFKPVLIILSGMSLFRSLRGVLKTPNIFRNLRLIFFGVIGQIVVLAFLQYLLGTPPTYKDIGIYSPFSDIHSYGSAILLLFFTCLGYFSSFRKTGKTVCGAAALILFYLILMSYSRITWLALIVGGSVYLFHQNFKKIAIISIVSLLALMVFAKAAPRFFDINTGFLTNRFISIFDFVKTIKEDSTYRLRLAKRSFQMIKEHPLTGTGIGSYYFLSTGYDKSDSSSFYENAHNYYLQLAAEMGVPTSLVFIILVMMLFIAYFQKNSSLPETKDLPIKGLIIGIFAYLLTLTTGHALLLIEQQLLFWAAVAVVCSQTGLTAQQAGLKYFVALSFLLIVLTLSGHAYNFIAQDNPLIGNTQNNYGYYGEENWGGKTMRWTGKKSSNVVKAQGNFIKFNLVSSHINSSEPEGLKVTVTIDDFFEESVHFFNGGDKELRYYLPGINGKDIVIKTEVSRTFNPKKLKISNDPRTLGIALEVIKFPYSIPQCGIGFYGLEEWDGSEPFKFRWTGRRASVALKDIAPENIHVLCSHPDIKIDPVEVRVFVDDKILWQKEINHNLWEKVDMDAENLPDRGFVTFDVSRTWNPKAMGISEDVRDLGIAVKSGTSSLFTSCDPADPATITDIDGNVYEVVQIGDQIWMAENLKTTKYNDGTSIPLVTDNTQWSQLSTPAYAFYNNDAANKEIYGALYNWHAVDTGKLCPTGWRVPNVDEWRQLIDYLGGSAVAGAGMKATGTIEAGTGLWAAPNEGAKNESGFAGIPGGLRWDDTGNFTAINIRGYHWSCSETVVTEAWRCTLWSDREFAQSTVSPKEAGISVRCIW